MDTQTILVCLIFFCCLVYTIRATIKTLRKKKGTDCGCGCTGCTMTKKDKKSGDCCSQEKH